MSRAYTPEEARDMLLDHMRHLAHYWACQPGQTELQRCEGMAFSILNIFDGTAGAFPCAVDLVLRPHPEDKQYSIDNGDNYCEDGQVINDCMLHDLFFVKEGGAP